MSVGAVGWSAAGKGGSGAETLGGLPGRLAADGIAGGAVHDALVAVTSASAGAELVSLDARAATTYRAMGVRYRMLA